MYKSCRLIFPVLLLLFGSLACAGQDNGSNGESGERDSGLERQLLRVGGQTIEVEIADNPRSRQLGLMFRDYLPADEGMLFVYPRPADLSFWMKNTRIPLDIAYIDEVGVIINIQAMEPMTTRSYPAPGAVPYALEMNQGWFDAHDITAGDLVQELPPLSTAR
ncbi:uncharacterized membrane protein (UPF0127 family) [Natronospira proteinivora]|uniref:Uncharacterized membrane protein (UPF0127 family) n=1 Tax=Natronospira proteinivora TaxID=1807133 RepID=A0ABT1GED8_9GAMM|nr:DUF192 domain-containing protein [Natronospira proteinivora]MCP1728588.1 uncharacterized membrane protein (UPF0127 family) [Natronospira proteinivora]